MRFSVLRAAAVVGAAMAFIAAPAHAQLPAGNLIQNPGAEEGTAVSDTAIAPPPQWDVIGNVSQVLYDSVLNPAPTGFPTTDVSAAIGGGSAFFSGGAVVAHKWMTQVIDFDAAAETRIAAGDVSAALNGDLGGYLTDGDRVSVSVRFRKNGETTVGDVLEIGPVYPSDRGDPPQTTLLPRSDTAAVDPQATDALVTVFFEGFTGQYTDGYADNLSLTLATPPSPPSPDTTAPKVAIALPPADFGDFIYYSSVDVAIGVDDPTATVRCALDPREPPTAFSDFPDGPCQFRPSSAVTVAPGAAGVPARSVYAVARDAAGNVSPIESVRFGLRVPPQTYLEGGPPASTPDKIAEFVFSTSVISDGPSSVPSPQCRVDGGAWYDCGNPGPYAGAPCCRYRSSTNLLGVGRHRIEVRSRDALGIDPTPAAYEWTVQPAKPKVVSGSCSYRIPWYSFSEFPLYRCTPIDSTVCPLSSRCTLETQALHSDDDPLNEERFEESPYASASGYFAAVSQGQIWKNDPGRVDVYRRCNAGKAAGNSVAGYTHRCTVANTYERVTVADAFEMRNECQGSRFGVFGTRPIIDRGPDGHRILQCTSKFTVEAVPSALGDALDSVTRAGAPILSVVAPSRGTMQASATFGGIGAITAAATQPGSRVAAKPTTVQVDAAGVVKLRLKLTKAALRKLRRPRGVRIVVTYEFTPDEGPALIRSREITLGGNR